VVDAIDEEKAQYMRGAKKRSHQIKSGRIPFSDKSAVWIRRRQVYHSILRYYDGKIYNRRANLKQAARRRGIHNALRTPIKEIWERLKVCEEKCDYYRRHDHRYWRKFLEKRLTVARIKRNSKAEKQILELIEWEKQRVFWRQLNYLMRKNKGSSVKSAQIQDDEGGVTEFTAQEEVEGAIWSEIHGKRFYLAEQAPICQGGLRGEFGYMANIVAAQEVLDGVYMPEKDEHQGTLELFEKIARI
jgi:hypothetical protein